MRLFTLLILFFSLNIILAQNTNGLLCDVNISCQNATKINIPIEGGKACIEGCNIEMPDNPFCSGISTPTAWFKFNSGNNNKVTIEIIPSQGISNPTFSISRECSGLIKCDSQVVLIAPNTDYSIAISDRDGNEGLFNLCITLELYIAPCVQDEILEVIETSLSSPLEGPYQKGEELTFRYSTNYYSGGNCQWIHSFIPTLGSCWGNATPQLLSYPEGTGQHDFHWVPKGSITWKPTTNFPPSPIGIGVDGNLCYIGTPGCSEFVGGGQCGTGGTSMPAGWVVSTPSGSCMGSSEPNVSWGAPQGCGSSRERSFTFKLKIPEVIVGCQSDGLKVGMTAFPDGATGGWNDPSCNGNGITFVDINVGTLSNNNLNLENFKLYPNPGVGMFKVELAKNISGDLELYNLNGYKTFQQQIDNNSNVQSLDLSELPSSIYNLIVRNSDGKIIGISKLVLLD